MPPELVAFDSRLVHSLHLILGLEMVWLGQTSGDLGWD